MGVSPMSPTGVPPVAKCEETAGNTGETPVLLTGKMPVLRACLPHFTGGHGAEAAGAEAGCSPSSGRNWRA